MESQTSVDELLIRICGRRSEATALVDGESRLSYRQLDDAVGAVAGMLREMGVRSGDPVAIILRNNRLFVASTLAVWRIGATAIPLSERYRQLEIARYIAGFGAKVVLVEHDVLTTIADFMNISAPDCRIVTSRSLLDGMAGHTSIAADEDAILSEVALCQFSSGTTGQSKQITRTRQQLLREAEFLSEGLDLSRQDRVLAVTPLHHTYGLADCFLAPLFVGATIVTAEEFRPADIAALIARERITVFPGVPFMFGLLADAATARDWDLSSLRLCVSAGSPLDESTFDKFRAQYGISIRQQYGTTELGAVAVNRAADVTASWHSVGHALNGVDVEVWNERGAPLPTGETGEIVVRSPAQATGYTEAPTAIGERSFREGWFLTGDVGRIDAEKNLYIVGRRKLFISTATHKVDPTEVEQILLSHPAVAEAVVVGVPGPYGSERVKAVLVLRSVLSLSDLKAYCKGLIADYKMPAIFEFTEALPKSAMGKILRKYLVEDHQREPDGSATRGLPERDLREQVAEILTDVLHLEQLRPQEDFFDLGGDSLKAIEIAAAIETALGVEVPQAAFYSNCNLDTITATVRALVKAAAGDSAIPIASRSETQAPAPERIASDDQQRELWEYLESMPREHRGCANVGAVVRIKGACDPERLRAAFARIVGRHDALRSRFPSSGCMIVDTKGALDVEIVDVGGLADKDVIDAMNDRWNRPFELVHGPLCRLWALVNGRSEWILGLAICHIIVDISSVTMLLDECLGEYSLWSEIEHSGQRAQLPDYLRWHGDYCGSRRGQSEAQYWEEKFRNPDQMVLFRQTGQRSRVAARLRVGREVIERLRAVSGARRGTTFEALLAAYVCVLYLQTGQGDILVGSPYSVRGARFMRTIGWITRTVYIRIGISRDATLEDVVLDVRRHVREAFAHALTAPTPPLARGAQYAMFALDNVRTTQTDLSAMALPLFPGSRAALHGLEIESVRGLRRSSPCDEFPQFGTRLMTLLSPQGECLGVLTSDVALLSARAVQQAVQRYASIIDGIVTAPHKSLKIF